MEFTSIENQVTKDKHTSDLGAFTFSDGGNGSREAHVTLNGVTTKVTTDLTYTTDGSSSITATYNDGTVVKYSVVTSPSTNQNRTYEEGGVKFNIALSKS